MDFCIVGTGRCGSKFLGSALHAHPAAAVFNETHWLPKMYELFGEQRVHWRRLLDVARKTTWIGGECLLDVNSQLAGFSSYQAFASRLEPELAAFGEMDIRVFSQVLAHALFDSPEYWGDKTPDYGYHMDLIRHLWPNCKFIHIVRHPLATAESMSRHPGFRLMAPSGHESWCALSYDRLCDAVAPTEAVQTDYLAYWSRRVNRIRAQAASVDAGKYLEIHYEDLVADPGGALAVLADYCGLGFSPAWASAVIDDMRPRPTQYPDDLAPLYGLLPEELQAVRSLYPGSFAWQGNELTAKASIRDRAELLSRSDDLRAGLNFCLSVLADSRIELGLNEKAALGEQCREALAAMGLEREADRWLAWLASVEPAWFSGGGRIGHRAVETGLDRYSPLRPISASAEGRRTGGVAVFSCVRNEREMLPYFLEYYRSLGVDSFYFVDNGSSDGSTQFLCSQADCNVFWTESSYAASNCGMDWINELLGSFSLDQWALVVDADELLVFPGMESESLSALTASLEREGADSFYTFMLDMYAGGAIADTVYRRGQNFLEICPFFDRSGYRRGYRNLPAFGGVRQRLFWEGKGYEKTPPYLPKVPLVRWRKGRSYQASTHRIEQASLGSATGVLLHFKLFSSFGPRVKTEIDRGEHWRGAIEYQIYNAGLAEHSGVPLKCELSQRYIDSRQLVELGLIYASDVPETACSNAQ